LKEREMLALLLYFLAFVGFVTLMRAIYRAGYVKGKKAAAKPVSAVPATESTKDGQ
jgi:hypothetical protein